MADSADRGGEQPQIEIKEFLSLASWNHIHTSRSSASRNLRRFLQNVPDSEKSQIGKSIGKKWSLSKKTFSVSLLV